MPEQKQFREYIATKETSDEENTATAAISTDTVDRDREILLPKGAELGNFYKNPVVLWAHDYSGTPVGKAKWIKSGRKYIKAMWTWAKTVKAQEIKQLWEGGFLNAISVGFIPKEGHEPTPKDIDKVPEWAEARRIVDKWELLEFSIVPVPANPDALASIKALNLSKETQEELGIGEDEETTVFMTPKTEETNNEEVEVKVEEKPIIVVPQRVLRRHRDVSKTRIVINPKDTAAQAANMLRGRMYM